MNTRILIPLIVSWDCSDLKKNDFETLDYPNGDCDKLATRKKGKIATISQLLVGEIFFSNFEKIHHLLVTPY